jgi:hypothetical protein
MGGDPQQLLSRSRELADRVRKAQRATWFPLLAFAAVTLAATPVYRFGHYGRTCRTIGSPPGQTGRVCSVYSAAGFVYWPIGLVLGYVAIAAFYLYRSRARGVGTRVQPYVIAGTVIAALLTSLSLWAAHHPPLGEYNILGVHVGGLQLASLYGLAGPAYAIGLGLLVLAWAERSRGLLVFAVGYLVAAHLSINSGRVASRPSPWFFLPHLAIDSGVLLLGAIGFALAQRAARQPSA